MTSSKTVVAFPRGQGLRPADAVAFLPAALEIVETPPSPIGRAITAAIIALFCLAIGWACLGSIDIIATAPGRIIPDGRIKVVQPFEIGVVRAIHVQDGQRVKAGDLLIAIDPTISMADSRHARDDLLAAQLDIARLRAALSDDADPLKAFHPPPGASAPLVAAQRELLSGETAEQRAKLAALDREAAEKDAERAAAAAAIGKIEALVPLLQQQVDMRKVLFEHQTGSKLSYLQTLQALVEQQQQLPIEKSHYREADAASASIRDTRAETADEYRSKLSDELVRAEAKAAGLQQDLIKAEERTRLERITAPVDGIVQQLAVHTIGGVVTPAQALLVIVPTSEHLEIEARLANQDVGFVHDGQTAALKIAAFPYTRYGLLYGKVLGVSADAITSDLRGDGPSGSDPAGAKSGGGAADPSAKEPTYDARISLDRTRMRIDSTMVDLQPGMAVTAEIKTGHRRIISYLLSPLLKYGHDALRQR